MAVCILASLSEDEATRLAYSRRQDEITNYYATLQQLENSLRRAEESDRRAEEERRRAEEERRRAEEERCRAEESDRRLSNAVRAMRAKKWTAADIAEALERPEEEIEKFL